MEKENMTEIISIISDEDTEEVANTGQTIDFNAVYVKSENTKSQGITNDVCGLLGSSVAYGDDESSRSSGMAVDEDSFGSSSAAVDTNLDGGTILNILLQNPEELSLNTKPSAIRHDKVFTLNSEVISMESMKADDNGPYVYKGTTTKSYYYDTNDGAFVVHKFDDYLYYYNKR